MADSKTFSGDYENFQMISQPLVSVLQQLEVLNQTCSAMASTLQAMSVQLKVIADAISSQAVGIVIRPGTPTHRDVRNLVERENPPMSKVKLIKKAHGKSAPSKAPKGFKAVDFVLQDNGDDTATVFGVDSLGNQLDISALATLTPAPTSSDLTIITVDPPSGMTFAMHAVGKLSVAGTPVQITATATWNDGSAGPFTFTLPVDVVSGGPTGILIVPGTPTVH